MSHITWTKYNLPLYFSKIIICCYDTNIPCTSGLISYLSIYNAFLLGVFEALKKKVGKGVKEMQSSAKDGESSLDFVHQVLQHGACYSHMNQVLNFQ